MKNLHTDLDKYADQWDKALKDGVFDDAPHLPAPKQPDFFGQWDGEEDVPINECDAKYWARVYELSKGNGPGCYPDPLTEVKLPDYEEIVKPSETKGDKDLLKKKADMVADDPNPQYPQGYGQDGVAANTGRTRISAGWAAEERIQELSDLKLKLYELECKVAEMKDSKGQDKIEAIKKQIDDLSNDLHGTWATSHMY